MNWVLGRRDDMDDAVWALRNRRRDLEVSRWNRRSRWGEHGYWSKDLWVWLMADLMREVIGGAEMEERTRWWCGLNDGVDSNPSWAVMRDWDGAEDKAIGYGQREAVLEKPVRTGPLDISLLWIGFLWIYELWNYKEADLGSLAMKIWWCRGGYLAV
jgi:hypothetical protein